MSEADKLFEELGYKKWIDSRNITHFIHKKKEKDFTFMNGNCYSIKRPTKKEQIAINKKVEELRMDMSNKTSDKNVGIIEDDVMSQEAFNELIDNFEVVATLTMYGRKSIKHYVKKMQAEREQKDKRILEMEEKMNADIMILIYELKQKDKQIQELEKEKIELKEYNKIVSDRIVEYKKNSISTQAVIDLIENETIDISGFECIAVEDLQELLEGEK